MRGKVLTVSILLLASLSLVRAQITDEFVGTKGKLYTKDNRVISGLINYDMERDLIHLENNGRIYSMNADQINSFILNDDGVTRYFESLPVQQKNGYVRSRLFELLYKGSVSLYTRVERMLQVNHRFRDASAAGNNLGQMSINNPIGYRSHPATSLAFNSQLVNHNFFITLRGVEYPLDIAERNYRKFVNAFPMHKDRLKKYIKKEDIDIKNPIDVAKVVEYYNGIIQTM